MCLFYDLIVDIIVFDVVGGEFHLSDLRASFGDLKFGFS